MRKYILLVICISCCFIFAACGDEENHSVTITLESNPEYEMEWVADQSDELFEITKEYSEDEVDGKMVGKTVFTLVPKVKGLNTVTFEYRYPGQETTSRSYQYAFIVDEDMRVSRGDEVGNGPAPLIN